MVFADAQGLDCGEEAAEWLTKFLGKPYRLLSHSPDIPKVKIQGKSNEFKHLGQEGEEVNKPLLLRATKSCLTILGKA